MKKLLAKEFRLCMVPMVPLFYLFVLMLLSPSYPYSVAGFFCCNAVFYVFSQAQMNNDLTFTAMLPVSKADVVRGRVRFVVLIQLGMIVLLLAMLLVRLLLYPIANPAGCDPCLTLLFGVFVTFLVFNAIYLPAYYKTPHRAPKHFLMATIAVFAWIVVFEGAFIAAGAAQDAVPLFGWIETYLDCIPTFTGAWIAQIAAACVGASVYAVGTWIVCKCSIARFERVDL